MESGEADLVGRDDADDVEDATSGSSIELDATTGGRELLGPSARTAVSQYGLGWLIINALAPSKGIYRDTVTVLDAGLSYERPRRWHPVLPDGGISGTLYLNGQYHRIQ